MCSPCSGARRSAGGRSSNCTGTLGSRYAAPVARDLAEVPVGHHLGVVEQLLDRLHRRPRRVDAGEQLLPLVVRARGELGRRSPRTRRLCGSRRVVGEAGSSTSSGRPISSQNGRQYRSDSRNTSWMCRPSLVRYVPTSGFGVAAAPTARGLRPCSADSRSDDSVHMAVASSDTSTTDPRPCAALEQRGGDPERERHAAVPVAHGASLRSGGRAVGRREDVGDAAARPERRGVVARRDRRRDRRRRSRAPGVDERRVAPAPRRHRGRGGRARRAGSWSGTRRRPRRAGAGPSARLGAARRGRSSACPGWRAPPTG